MLWKNSVGSRTSAWRAMIALLGLTAAVLLVALSGAGCSRGPAKSAAAGNAPAEAASASSEREALPPAPESAPAPPEPAPRLIPGGSVLSVRLLESLSSRTARPGQTFAAELAASLTVDGRLLLPRSTRVRGRVVSARPSGRLHDPGYLRLTLDALQTPDGKWIDVQTTSVSARGKSHKKRNLTFIGGGSGLGAIVGGIAGGGKGAAIGAASGAGAGTAAAYATGKEEVTFSAERKLRFTTVETVVMNR